MGGGWGREKIGDSVVLECHRCFNIYIIKKETGTIEEKPMASKSKNAWVDEVDNVSDVPDDPLPSDQQKPSTSAAAALVNEPVDSTSEEFVAAAPARAESYKFKFDSFSIFLPRKFH